MALFRKNEGFAAKRRVALFLYADDGVTPAPLATSWASVAASVALTGTHHATLTYSPAGSAGNSITVTLTADGSGVGSLTLSGSAYTFHYQSGVTTMANFLAAASGVFTFSGHTPADVLVSPGDTQGPLALAGGLDLAWQVRAGGTSYANAAGTWMNTGVDGEWIYEATQAELNFVGSEFGVKVQRAGFLMRIVTCDMNDAADFDSIGEGSNTYGDLMRLVVSAIASKVSGFTTGTLAFRSLDDTKTRLTVLTSTVGRIASIIGDLSP